MPSGHIISTGDFMTGIFQIILLTFSLYGMASILWDMNNILLKPKIRNNISYYAFLPLGSEDELEQEIRSSIDYAQEINCEPVIITPSDWSEEKEKIASLIAKECEIYIHKI